MTRPFFSFVGPKGERLRLPLSRPSEGTGVGVARSPRPRGHRFWVGMGTRRTLKEVGPMGKPNSTTKRWNRCVRSVDRYRFYVERAPTWGSLNLR